MTYELLLEKIFLAWKFCIVYCTATGVLIFIELLHVMALGHYMREKSTESKDDSPAESTQTAETIESGSAGTAGKTRKGGQKQGKKPKGESRNK